MVSLVSTTVNADRGCRAVLARLGRAAVRGATPGRADGFKAVGTVAAGDPPSGAGGPRRALGEGVPPRARSGSEDGRRRGEATTSTGVLGEGPAPSGGCAPGAAAEFATGPVWAGTDAAASRARAREATGPAIGSPAAVAARP